MKVSIRSRVEWMPEGAYHRALKAVAEVVEGVSEICYGI